MKKRIVFGAIVAALWLALPAAAAAPIVSLGTGVLEVPVGQTVPLPVSVADIQDLYGIEFHLRFDPAVVQVADADPSTNGVQVAEGDFLSADFVAQNEVDNQAGTIDYAVMQVNPNEPRSGGGTLLTIRFQGVGAGRTSQLEVEAIVLTTRDGDVIPVTVTDEEIRVKDAPAVGDTATPSPTSGPPAAPPSVTATPQSPALGDTRRRHSRARRPPRSRPPQCLRRPRQRQTGYPSHRQRPSQDSLVPRLPPGRPRWWRPERQQPPVPLPSRRRPSGRHHCPARLWTRPVNPGDGGESIVEQSGQGHPGPWRPGETRRWRTTTESARAAGLPRTSSRGRRPARPGGGRGGGDAMAIVAPPARVRPAAVINRRHAVVVCANPLLWRFFTYRAARLSGVGQRWLPASSAAMIGLVFSFDISGSLAYNSVKCDHRLVSLLLCDVHQFAMVLAFCPAVRERPRVVI